MKPDTDCKCFIRHIKKTPVKSSYKLPQALFVDGSYLFKQNNGVLIQAFVIGHDGMGGQLCFCMFQARDGGDDDDDC